MAEIGTLHVSVLARQYTKDGLVALGKLIDEAEAVMVEQMELGHEADDSVAEMLAEGWQESAEHFHEVSDRHWRAFSIIRNLLDELPTATIAEVELKLDAEGVTDAAGRFSLALSESLDRRVQ
jgi:hypothetical protein